MFLRRADLPPTSLLGLQMAVFGLGDSSYSRFNVASKMLEARLLQLGASKVIPRGDGDDQHRLGLYGGLLPWLDSLSSYLSSLYPLPPGQMVVDDSNAIPTPRYKIHFLNASDLSSDISSSSSNATPPSTLQLRTQESYSTNNVTTDTSYRPNAASQISSIDSSLDSNSFHETHPYVSYVIENTRITAEDWTQDVRHVALASSGLNWKPGDVVYVKPVNFPEDVEQVLKLFSVQGNEIVTAVERLDEEAPSFALNDDSMGNSFSKNGSQSNEKLVGNAIRTKTTQLTLRKFVSEHLDISGVPRRYFFELLSHFAIDELQALKLKQLASAEGQEDLHDYARRAKRSFIDVFTDFSSARPPIDYLLDVFPKLQPRAFSISSSQADNPSQLTISMVVVRYRSAANRLRRGVCSTWISGIHPISQAEGGGARDRTDLANLAEVPEISQYFSNASCQKEMNCDLIPIPIWIKPGTMSLPTNTSTPIIFVGPGTGCAIFRSFIQERMHLLKSHAFDSKTSHSSSSSMLGPAHFFFGCRHEAKDFLYRDLWLDAIRVGALDRMTVAFSQDRAAKVFERVPLRNGWAVAQESNRMVESGDASSPSTNTSSTSPLASLFDISEHSIEIPQSVSKAYVQVCLKEDAVKLWSLVHEHNASIFVCGNANKMPTDVRNAFIYAAMQVGGLSDVDAEKYIRNLEARRRYCVESWS